MKNFLISTGIFASMMAISLGAIALTVSTANAGVTFSVPSGQASGYLNSNDVEVFEDSGINPRYLKWEFADGTIGHFTFNTIGEPTYLGSIGPWGGANWSAYAGSYLTPSTEPDWSVDGDYIFGVYSDVTLTTLVMEGTWCQGDSCEGEPPPEEVENQGGATSTIDQQQQNLFHGYFLMFVGAFFAIFALTNNRR